MHENAVESRVRSAGVELAVRELPAAGATVVLVHGFPDNSSVWDPLARLLHDRHGIEAAHYDISPDRSAFFPRPEIRRSPGPARRAAATRWRWRRCASSAPGRRGWRSC